MKKIVIDENSIKYEIRDKIRLNEITIDVPATYRGKGITMLLPVSTKKILKLIDCPFVKPAEIFFGKSLLCITIFDFSQSPVGPYTELVFATPVSYKSKFRLPLFSLIKDEIFKKYNLFVIDIAQSTKIAIEHGNLLTGYPHNPNIIDVVFKEGEKDIFISSSGDGKNILDIEINKPKKERRIKESYITYFIKDNNPYKIQMDIYGVGGNVKINKFNLGNHNLSELIKSLGGTSKPFQALYCNDVIEINPVNKKRL